MQTTLIGTLLAKEGREFIYRGETEKCGGCPHRDSCLNLEEGVRYRVTEVIEGKDELDCSIHEEGVSPVKVEEAPIVASVGSRKAFEGAVVSLNEDACDRKDCPGYKYCVPEGCDFDESYEIEEVLGDNPADCHYDRSLKLVELSN